MKGRRREREMRSGVRETRGGMEGIYIRVYINNMYIFQ